MIKNKFTIRKETKDDYDKIYELVEEAFKTAKVSDGDEQEFVNKLRNSSRYIPELALVGEIEGEIVAHVMLTEIPIKTANKTIKVLLLGPVCVQLKHRNKKLGTKIIGESVKRAKDKGYKAIFLVGDPNYYMRLGFKSSESCDIKNTNNIEDKYAMYLELEENSLKSIKGSIDFINME